MMGKTNKKNVRLVGSGSGRKVQIKAAVGLTAVGEFAVLGPKNTYSDFASDRYIAATKGRARLVKKYYRTIGEVFEAVEKGTAAGIVPLENVIYGSVRETLDQLFIRKVHIGNKLRLKIEHALVTLPSAKKSDIHTIASHEQAIEQCSMYLEKNFRFAQKEYSTSTMSALEKMIGSHDGGLAVIIPLAAAKNHHLKILARKMENSVNNYTTFIIIERGDYRDLAGLGRGKPETAIAFYFRKDSPGRLYMVFREFANAGINLSHIESRPSTRDVGNFIFFLQFDGSPTDHKTAPVLESIRSKVAGLKILGVYPKA
jgi:prephenate dehydratase